MVRYGQDPPHLSSPGWLVLYGTVGLAVDVWHVWCGVKQTVAHDDSELPRHWWISLHIYGSMLVLLEGLICTARPGAYLDPIMTLFLAGIICWANTSQLLRGARELYHSVEQQNVMSTTSRVNYTDSGL